MGLSCGVAGHGCPEMCNLQLLSIKLGIVMITLRKTITDTSTDFLESIKY